MEGRDEAGRFAAGNRFWEVRSSAGPKPKFDRPEKLWSACCEYFEWVEANPLQEDRLVTFQGAATHEPVAKMRAMTITGLCSFLDVSRSTWDDWRDERADLADVISRAEAVIYEQKFAGAAADLLNANIIARDLGLKDQASHEHTGKDGGAIRMEDVTKRDADAFTGAIAGLAARGGAGSAVSDPDAGNEGGS